MTNNAQSHKVSNIPASIDAGDVEAIADRLADCPMWGKVAARIIGKKRKTLGADERAARRARCVSMNKARAAKRLGISPV